MTTNARDLLWMIFILIVVGVVWSLSGKSIGLPDFGSGPRLSPNGSIETENKTESIFGSQENPAETSQKTETISSPSPISITLSSIQTTDAQKEYITIRNVSAEDINLTRGEIKNKNNISVKIEPDENGKPVILRPRDSAVILTGKTTKGANFKINKCSGYFSQFHEFTPSISGRCPTVDDLPEVANLDDECVSYLPQIRSCQTPPSLPTNLSSNCQQFIQQHANYSGCVADHKNDEDFDPPSASFGGGGGEWRIFLNRTSEMWGKRNEIIKIIDSAGKNIAEASY